jgi:cellulose synthase/poly-beta-1,6-N-acetylglucosamine synthase-like glycosyltransferase
VLAGIQAVLLTAFVLAELLLGLYSSHRTLVLWRWWRSVSRKSVPPAPSFRFRTKPGCRDWSRITVQLPIYNERLVVDRLLDSVAALDYPADRLEIQVLDDSTDETRLRAAAAVARHRARGTDIRHLHRTQRSGYKAGALAAGLAEAKGELVAVFDADFVPPSGFLRRLVPHFDDPAVGMVQARWEHLNRDRSLLTAAQAAMLDAHFLVEHRARMASGLFINFNGAAGLWRRACIEDAGGWSHDTLTEDLDLSYRAQLRGWRFVFDPNVHSAAELPGDIEALKSQQRRWAKGSIQTARKVLPSLLSARLPARVKLEAFFHLTGNAAYPLVLAVALLLWPVLLGTRMDSPAFAGILQMGVSLLGVLQVALFLAVARRASGGGPLQLICDVPAALVLGVGLSLNNARAVIEGMRGRVGNWERTPKTGDGSLRTIDLARYDSGRGLSGRAEIALAAYLAAVTVFAGCGGHYRTVPFLMFLLAGFLYVGTESMRSSLGRRCRLGTARGG